MRPIAYIQAFIDPKWNNPAPTDPVITPPFPEYPSGHSTEIAAAAAVLGALFGEDYLVIDRTQERLGFEPRVFDSFAAVAEEAALSRLYGGIHFRSGNEGGLAQGRCIGQRVLELRISH
jgi:membrane-associated phospholipid phosphatase